VSASGEKTSRCSINAYITSHENEKSKSSSDPVEKRVKGGALHRKVKLNSKCMAGKMSRIRLPVFCHLCVPSLLPHDAKCPDMEASLEVREELDSFAYLSQLHRSKEIPASISHVHISVVPKLCAI